METGNLPAAAERITSSPKSFVVKQTKGYVPFFSCVRLCVVVSGGALGAGGVPGVQAGLAQRVQAAGRTAAGAGSSAHQDRRQQDEKNLRLPDQRGLHHEGMTG